MNPFLAKEASTSNLFHYIESEKAGKIERGERDRRSDCKGKKEGNIATRR